MHEMQVLDQQDRSSAGPSSPSQSIARRTLKIEPLGDPWRGRHFSGIRLKGRWLVRAGFHPGQRVTVTISAPGALQLRSLPESWTAGCDDPHELAMDQATNSVSIPVSDPLKEAHRLLMDTLCHEPKHDSACAGQNFANHNRHLPPAHPAWKSAPACNCWVGRMAAWLEANPQV